ncbi:HXXEE domain-containing protein [Paenibacillus silvae]|uniref:HXXEE domain-containing protein n=1 Tax=Paenibacillus silvae TaxID=1325358 RepID=UPI00119C91C9|nr:MULTISPECIES: HXXEE domain-containing protein [Paenibacillus]MCK6077171.1 HXXEE domain-containing protein [Paenibacillus silvae]MCK6151368.1 HXXEE domain-containing protein [Paenibacillus silvae]MCK6269857.1 HXXEE domain-containing protein [Paenibacillus silvae]
MNMLRKYWPDLGMLVAAVTAIGIVMNLRSMSELSMILWLSFIAILVHQFEEYRWPGYFGGLFNIVIFKSEQPTRYPLNPQSAMVINLVIAYVFYLLPVFFPTFIWLALAPIFMGFFQFVWHGLFANIKAKTWYNPGLFAVLVFHFPIGGWYLYYITEHKLASTTDWIIGLVYFVIAVYLLIIKGNMWLKDIHSPFHFSDKQMGPYHNK